MLFAFSEIKENQLQAAGSKAANLCRMSREGLPVPPGAVLTVEAFDLFKEANQGVLGSLFQTFQKAADEPNMLKETGKQLFERIQACEIPGKVLETVDTYRKELASQGFSAIAVRSSGNLEDTTDASFAGQYETILNVKTREQLSKALLACWASAYNERVLTYCLRKKLDPNQIRLSVVLQAMVPADASGVLFTVDPMTGRDTVMIIEAVKGLGEALVQGAVTPDITHFDWYKEEVIHAQWGEQTKGLFPAANGEIEWKPVTSKSPAISEAQAGKLSELALKAQMHYGFPQDLEWALLRGEFYLLQARPITSIRFEVDQDWTNADFKDGGISSTITTPYMWSLYRRIFSTTMPTFLRQVHIYPDYEPEKWATWFFGYPYWNISAVKNGAKKIPGFVERKFDEDLGIEPDYPGDGHKTRFTPASLIRGIKILLATTRSIKAREDKSKAFKQQIAKVFEVLNRGDWGVVSGEEFCNFHREALEKHYVAIESFYFYTIYDNSNATTFYHEALEKYNRKAKEKVKPLKLIGGLEQLSHMRPVYDLWELRNQIKQDSAAKQYYSENSEDEINSAFHRGEEIPFRSALASYLQKYPHHSLRELDILVPNWEEDATQVLESLKSMLVQNEEQSPILQNARQNQVYQEERKKIRSSGLIKKLEAHRKMLWWREEMRDQSTRMYYWLRKLGLEAGKRLVEQGVIEKPEDYFFLEYHESLALSEGINQEVLQNKILKNKIYYQCFRNWEKPNEIWSRERNEPVTAAEGEDLLKGIGCSSGRMVGTVSVVEDIFNIDKLEESSILVTQFTDPAWTPVFARISGLITETGGMLSHGAVVSREYGIPAVLAVKGATNRLKSGMKVEIDGDQGVIKILENGG